VQGEVDQFREAVRKQLSRDDIHETFSLVGNIENVIKLLSYKAKQSSIHVLFDYDHEDEFKYFGNPLKFHQVALNLILNALESFAASGERRVFIRLLRKSDNFIFQVEDSGEGISISLREKIFEPFFTTKQEKGMGIGLAITKRIIENDLQGVIFIESGKKQGSIFTVRFPVNINHHRDYHGKNNQISD
jgi:two-component system, NtrC family, C4-dicarboxylate transport sensor histidine kinase DctB